MHFAFMAFIHILQFATPFITTAFKNSNGATWLGMDVFNRAMITVIVGPAKISSRDGFIQPRLIAEVLFESLGRIVRVPASKCFLQLFSISAEADLRKHHQTSLQRCF